MRFDASLYERALAALGKPSPIAETVPQDKTTDGAAEIAAALCREFEGFISKPYICPAGVPTIGFGATHYLDGRRVSLNDPAISKEAANRLLLRMIDQTYLPSVLRLCPGVTDARKLAALVDFTFNLGAGNLQASTLRKRVNAGDWESVPAELRKWVYGGGRKLPGLVRRREAEIALIERSA